MTYLPKKGRRLRQVQRQKMSMKKITMAISFAALGGAVLFILNNLGTSDTAMAAAGKDGTKTISAANTIVNEFTTLSSNVSAGGTSLTVASSSLNANGRFSAGLASGDLVMIIQMQGATISTADNAAYGAVSSYGNCGLYEFASVSAVPNATTITLATGLKNSYTSAGKVQVVRVPRYTTLTINAGGSISTSDWDGSKGGIVAIEAASTVTINGSINVNGKGFRGGVIEQHADMPGGHTIYRSTSDNEGAEKGESIAGYQSSYTNGRYGRGAPANGGGGGNAHNASGGGGANGGVVASWTGMGTPDTSVSSWKTAWNLESVGFASTSSSGGGRGGYAYSANAKNPLTVGPNNATWGGDSRYNVGGYGGRPLDYSGGRIFMGGGGGAGDSNDGTGTSGADGAGIVFLLVKGNVTGTGTIYANGDNGSTTSGPLGWDGTGGGGGGGAVVIYHYSGAASSISIQAKGGTGGNQNLTGDPEAEGAGGGGGGGFVAITGSPAISINVTGGSQGSTNSTSVSSFTPNGGTKGGSGTSNGTAPTNPYSSANPLPVVLRSFKVEPAEGVAMISWETASEKDNDYFIIEKSTDGFNYHEVCRESGAGNSSSIKAYRKIDSSPSEGTSYYRLTQVDFNGKNETFNPVALQMGKITVQSELKLNKIAPNPFTDEFTISVNNPENTNMAIELFTQEGRKVWEGSQQLDRGSQMLVVHPEIEQKGVFIVRISSAEGLSSSARIIRN